MSFRRRFQLLAPALALLSAVPAFSQTSAPAIVTTSGYLNGTSLTSHTTSPFNSTGATTLVVFVSTNTPWNGATVTISGVTDNLGNTWNLLTGPTTWVGSTNTLLSAIYYTNAPATSTSDTVTATLSNPAPLVMHVFAVSGSDVTVPPISSAISSPAPGGTSAIVASSPPIMVPANSLLLGWAKNETGGTATATGGYLLDSSQSTSYLWAESQMAPAPGSYTSQFQYDPAIGWQTALVEITASTAPVAFNQSTTTGFNTPLNIALLATSRTGGMLTYSVLTGPTHGVLAGTAPNLTYVPNAGYSGGDSFTFKANDGITDSNIATVSITVHGSGASVLSSVGYDNGNPQTSHTSAAFNTIPASTLVAFVSSHPQWPWPGGASVSINGLTDNVGNTWTLLSGPTTWIGSSYGLVSAIYYVNSPHTSATHTVTALLSNPAPLVLHVFAVSGSAVMGPPISSAITSPVPGGASASVASAPINAPANTLLLGWVKNETSATATTFGGYTLDPQSVSFLWAESQGLAPAGPYSSLFNYDSAIGWQTAVVGVLPSTGAPPPPAPTITASPANPTNQTSASFSFSDTQTGVTFLCQLDTTAFTACTSPISYAGPLAQGSHTFSVEARDSFGNLSNSTTYNWTINTPPTFTTQPASTTINSGQTATFTVVAAGPPPLTYQWFMGSSGDTSQPIAGATATSYTTPALTATASYWVMVSNGGGSANSATGTVTVNRAATTTTLTVSPNPSIFGQAVTFQATVAAGASGSVNFLDGTTSLGTASLSGGAATLTTSQLAVGSHSVTAAYAGNSGFAPSTSPAITQVVNLTATTTTLTATPNSSVTGQTVTLSSSVSVMAPGTGTVTGSVTFHDGTTVLGTATLSGGSASLAVTTLAGGSHSLTATYTASGNFAGSSSSAVTETVNAASTTTTLTASPSPSVAGQSVTFTAAVSVTSPGTGTATGSVTFKDGTTTLGTVTLSNGTATLSTTSLALGSHSLSASYGGSTQQNTSTSATVTQTVTQISTTTSLSASPNPSTLNQSVTLIATVSSVAPGTGTPTGTITFKDGTTTLGTAALTNGTASLAVSGLAVGSHSLTAGYGGATNFLASTSTAVTQAVNVPSTTTALTATPNPSALNQSVTLKATVSVIAPGSGTPTGTVTFNDGTTTLGSANLSGGTASLTTSTLSAGTHSLTAVYGGGTGFLGSSSTSVTQTVNPPSTTTVLTSSFNPSGFSQSVTLKAVVSAVAPPPGTGPPTGSVNFKDGSTVIGAATLSGGAAIINISTFTGGSHSLTAVFAGGANFAGSTSALVTQIVNLAPTTTVLSPSPMPSVYGQPVTLKASISSGAGSNMTGSVTFKDGTSTLGAASVSGGIASMTVPTLSPGNHSLTAVYTGDGNFAGSTSSVQSTPVFQASTTTAVVSSVNPSVFGQTVNLVATISPVAPGSGTPTGSVSFRDGSTTIGTATLSGGSASLAVSSLAVGSHSITAVYNDDSNFNASTSTAVTQVVNRASTSTALTASPNPSNFGQTVTLRATVSAVSPGGGAPTGSVVFEDGSTTLSTVSLSNGVATLSTNSLARGTHTITAAYQQSSSYNASTSTAVTQTIQ